jgi:outer membrane protein insertion porin family
MVKPTLALTRFFKLSRKSAVSVNAELGYIHSFKSDNCVHSFKERLETGRTLCVPESERFFTGGESSVRGFEYGAIGPHEDLGSGRLSPVGGYKHQTYNIEYVYRVNDPLRLVLFADAGYSYGFGETIDFEKLRYTTGAELRIFLPVFQFPLRFIYAINPREQEEDRFESFQFTIGNTF